MKNKITYDDTRDIAIRIIEFLLDKHYLTEDKDIQIRWDNEWDFHLQDGIQDKINDVLGLDIDDKFEITIK